MNAAGQQAQRDTRRSSLVNMVNNGVSPERNSRIKQRPGTGGQRTSAPRPTGTRSRAAATSSLAKSPARRPLYPYVYVHGRGRVNSTQIATAELLSLGHLRIPAERWHPGKSSEGDRVGTFGYAWVGGRVGTWKKGGNGGTRWTLEAGRVGGTLMPRTAESRQCPGPTNPEGARDVLGLVLVAA